MTKRYNWQSILIVGLCLLFATLFLACSVPTRSTEFTRYRNDTWGYTISYPSNWSIEIIDTYTTEISLPAPSLAHIELYADENLGLPIESEAQIWLEGTTEAFSDVLLLKSIGSKDSWDWYLAYDYFMPEHDITFHGEAYMKQTEKNFYRICLEAEKGDYSQYPFGEVVSTFALLAE